MHECPKTVSGNHHWERGFVGTDVSMSGIKLGTDFMVRCNHCGMVDDTAEMNESEISEQGRRIESNNKLEEMLSKQIEEIDKKLSKPWWKF